MQKHSNKSESNAVHSEKELLEWAAEQRMKYHRGELLSWQIEELEKTPGWTWDVEEAKRLGR